MRIAKLTPQEGEKLVIWDKVTAVRYIAEGPRRFLVLTYRNGAERNLEPHQARDLWYDVEEHKDCPAPCYYRHESETAPHECMSCQLAQCLEGIDVTVRPAPLPPRRRRPRDWRNLVIAGLVALVLLLIAALDSARRSPAPPDKVPDESPLNSARGHLKRIGEGR